MYFTVLLCTTGTIAKSDGELGSHPRQGLRMYDGRSQSGHVAVPRRPTGGSRPVSRSSQKSRRRIEVAAGQRRRDRFVFSDSSSTRGGNGPQGAVERYGRIGERYEIGATV